MEPAPGTKSPEPEPTRIQPPKPVSFTNGQVTYKECLKNHAATLGGHAVDGCGEFMPSADLKCAACGCHRNFHRRHPEAHTHVVEYQPHHRHHPPPPHNSASPPPISSSYYPSAPHMLLALSAANRRKRFRTKFSQTQKEKMQEFADRVGWKIQKRDDQLVHRFCDEVGVDRGVLKVWMHNNKNTLAKRHANANRIANNNGGATNGSSSSS